MNRTLATTENETTDTSTAQELASADSHEGKGEYFGDVVRQRIERRAFLKGAGLGAGALAVPTLLAPRSAAAVADPGARITFTPIVATDLDTVVVPDKYTSNVVIRWGDPILAGGPAFDLNNQLPASQAKQFGFNCDFVAQYPLPSWYEFLGQIPFLRGLVLGILGGQFPQLRRSPTQSALLWSNHEYTTGVDMFPGYTSANPTQAQVDIELEGHGGSLVLIRFEGGQWVYKKVSAFNRRITGFTPIAISGPVAGHPLVQTADDPAGTTVLGMLNNCGGGITPWGTVLTAEENFDQYFGGRTALTAADPAKAAFYSRIPATAGESERKWERYYPRFDVSKHPNEYARFGWVVEMDPYDPSSQPRKRTALGRFKHEAAANTLSKEGHVVVYSGDDARFEYMYKFVSDGQFNAWDRAANLELLDSGTLYVAKLNADGTGQWLPLVWGDGPLTAANGFPGQAEVLINARRAADLLARDQDGPARGHRDQPGHREGLRGADQQHGPHHGGHRPRRGRCQPPSGQPLGSRVRDHRGRWRQRLAHVRLGDLPAVRGSRPAPGHLLRGLRPHPGQPHLLPGQPGLRRGRQPVDRHRRRAGHHRVHQPQRRHLRRSHRGSQPGSRAAVPQRPEGLRDRLAQAVERQSHHLRQHPAPR